MYQLFREKNGYNNYNNGNVVEDRVYTKEEIIQLLDHADLRTKVIIFVIQTIWTQ